MEKVLIVVDMQNDFVSGSLGTPEAQAIVSNVRRKVESAKKKGYKIIFTRDTHQANYLDTSEGKKLPVEHCIENTWGWEIIDELDTENCRVINKPTFGYKEWESILSVANAEHNFFDSYTVSIETPKSIEVIGLCTDICVIANCIILKTLYPDAEITVNAKCCAGVTPESHEAALKVMKMCQINVIGE